jgi:hypothetical protein
METNKLTGKFIKIPNNFFTVDKDNFFGTCGTKGFFLYSYLIYKQQNNENCEISIKMIQEFLNRDYDKRPTIRYGKRENNIDLLKDTRTISKLLLGLHRLNFITIHNVNIDKENINNIVLKSTQTLIIECHMNYDNGFIAIPSKLYFDKIHKIGHIGWSIFCLLSKLFNKSFGSKTCEGYANPSQDYMSDVLKVNEHTISAYSDLLQSQKLIKIKEQGYIIKAEKITGEEIREYLPNNYIVNYMLSDNKYNIGN